MIIGAGFSGLIAAHVFPKMEIAESMPEPVQSHKALLRFRSDVVSQLTGIKFKKVVVRKGIYTDGDFKQPTIRLANLYSQKCHSEIVSDRSIWNISACERFIAPENFYEQLIDHLSHRIRWGQKFNFDYFHDLKTNSTIRFEEPVISTMPMSIAVNDLGVQTNQVFRRKEISVLRMRIRGVSDIYQTIYYPDTNTVLYRASVTDNLAILEMIPTRNEDDIDRAIRLFCHSFGITPLSLDKIETVSQKFGKISPIEDDQRKKMIYEMTDKFNVYSLGRFAVWKNILLDDVVSDARVIKTLMESPQYKVSISRAK